MNECLVEHCPCCRKVPKHLEDKISQRQWDWINTISIELHTRYIFNTPPKYYRDLYAWQIRGYWLITYFCNPSIENLNFLSKNLFVYRIFDKTTNLEYLEFMSELQDQLLTGVKN